MNPSNNNVVKLLNTYIPSIQSMHDIDMDNLVSERVLARDQFISNNFNSEQENKQEELSIKQKKINEYAELTQQLHNLQSRQSTELQLKQQQLETFQYLQQMLDIRCTLETSLAIMESSTFSEEAQDTVLTQLQKYHQHLQTIPPTPLQHHFNSYKDTFYYYLNTANTIVSTRLSHTLQKLNFPTTLPTDSTSVIRDYNFLHTTTTLHSSLQDSAVIAIMTSTIIRVQHHFLREESGLRHSTSLDLFLPFVQSAIEKIEKYLQSLNLQHSSLLTPLLKSMQFRLNNDLPQLPALYILMFLEQLFDFCNHLNTQEPLTLLNDPVLLDVITIALKEAARIKVEYVISQDNDVWAVPLHKGSAEFLLLLNEAVGIASKASIFASEFIANYVFELLSKFEEYLKEAEMYRLKEVCGVANSWFCLSLAVEKNTERMKSSGVNINLLKGKESEFIDESKSAVLVIVDDFVRIMDDENWTSFNEAVDHSVYLLKRNEDIKHYLMPQAYAFFQEKMKSFKP
ncbi:DH domain-containing protein [Entamoeba marina]